MDRKVCAPPNLHSISGRLRQVFGFQPYLDSADRVRKKSHIPGRRVAQKVRQLRPVALNGLTKTPKLLRDIQDGLIIVFLSPEIALSEQFCSILQDQTFQQCLVLIAINKLHVIE